MAGENAMAIGERIDAKQPRRDFSERVDGVVRDIAAFRVVALSDPAHATPCSRLSRHWWAHPIGPLGKYPQRQPAKEGGCNRHERCTNLEMIASDCR